METYKNIDELGGIEFEDLFEKLISKMGFITERTKRSFDGGISIFWKSKDFQNIWEKY